MADRTFVIIKPDAVERGLAGEIISRFERKGLRIVAMELRTIDAETASPPLRGARGQAASTPSCSTSSGGRRPSPLVLEGPEDTWKVVRTLMGATNPREAAPGTIRGDYGVLLTENLVHGSDGPESAAREIGIFFPEPPSAR